MKITGHKKNPNEAFAISDLQITNLALARDIDFFESDFFSKFLRFHLFC